MKISTEMLEQFLLFVNNNFNYKVAETNSAISYLRIQDNVERLNVALEYNLFEYHEDELGIVKLTEKGTRLYEKLAYHIPAINMALARAKSRN